MIENTAVNASKEARKYEYFLPVQQSTIMNKPIPAPNKENQGNSLSKKKRKSAKSATINKAKKTWFNNFNSSKLY